MNSEPIIKEVEETFHLSIPQARVASINNIISKNPDISLDLARDLVLSAAMGIRVPNPKTDEPEDGLARIDTLLAEVWYNVKRITAKTLTFEPVDIILNRDKQSVSMHIRWTYKGMASESTQFVSYKKYEKFAEFAGDLYDKLNRSLNTSQIPYRLIFLNYGKMARFAFVTLATARKLVEGGKLVYDNLYLSAREKYEEPEINTSLVPSMKELLEDIPHQTQPGDHIIAINRENAENIAETVKNIIDLHPGKPDIGVEVKPDTFMLRKPDAFVSETAPGDLETMEIVFSTDKPYAFLLDDRFYFNLPGYLNAALAKSGSGVRFYAFRSDYACETFAIACCAADQTGAFADFGYIYEPVENWARNKKLMEEKPAKVAME